MEGGFSELRLAQVSSFADEREDRLDACLGWATAGNVSFLSERATRSLVVIVAMLGTVPRRRRKSTAHSSGDQPLRNDPPECNTGLARASAGPIGEAYARFLELPAPVVFVALWLLGALLLGLVLGVVLVVSYSAEALLLAVIALLA